MDSSSKNKIYALVSIFVIVLTVMSFFEVTRFLLKINNLVFNVDQNIVKEQTTELNKNSFEKIKSKLNPEKNNINDNEGTINSGSVDNINFNGDKTAKSGDSTNSVTDTLPSPEASFSPVVKPTASPAFSPSPEFIPET